MYEGMGYSVFRTVKEYYGGLGPDKEAEGRAEDAYGKYVQVVLIFH